MKSLLCLFSFLFLLNAAHGCYVDDASLQACQSTCGAALDMPSSTMVVHVAVVARTSVAAIQQMVAPFVSL